MATIDWSSPQIIAGCITGLFALITAAVAGLLQRQKSKAKEDGQHQQVAFSKDVHQIQAKGDISIGMPPTATKAKVRRKPAK